MNTMKENKKPLLGFIICSIFGLIGLFSNVVAIIGLIFISSQQNEFNLLFPFVRTINIFTNTVGLPSNMIYILGAFLSYRLKTIGFRLIKAVSWFMFASSIILSGFVLYLMTNSENWIMIPERTQWQVIGGIIGGGFGGIIQALVTLFLFRKYLWKGKG